MLRQTVPLNVLRAEGAFFSGHALSRRLLDSIASTLNPDSVVADPACGAGDLLIAASDRLPIDRDVPATLELWGRHLIGRDIHQQFIEAASLRLALAAVARGAVRPPGSVIDAPSLVGLSAGSCLDASGAFGRATHFVMNPPFSAMEAPDDCLWGSGRVNSAAVFLEQVVRSARTGATIAAILPDVLRSGTRYARWRKLICGMLDVQRIEVVGRFAEEVDVDVFIMVGVVVARRLLHLEARQWVQAPGPGRTVGDLFEVSVGPLVPHREPNKGRWGRLVQPGDLPPWQTVRRVAKGRRFSGSTTDGPFVAVRRTSRPGDGIRAVAAAVDLDRPAVVENHLLVLRPRDGAVETCERLVQWLRRPETTRWLDERIRCRHLTVGAVRDLPVWPRDPEQ
jgi:hypothetical protein